MGWPIGLRLLLWSQETQSRSFYGPVKFDDYTSQFRGLLPPSKLNFETTTRVRARLRLINQLTCGCHFRSIPVIFLHLEKGQSALLNRSHFTASENCFDNLAARKIFIYFHALGVASSLFDRS